MTTAVSKPQELIRLEAECEALLKEIAKTTVENEDEKAQAADWLARVRGFLKGAEELRKELVGPLNEQVKAINSAFTTALISAKEAETNLNKGLSNFFQEQQRLQRLEQARLDKLAEKRAEKAEAQGVVSPIPEIISAVAARPEKTTVTEAGTVGMREIPKWRWLNESQKTKATSKLPDDYWIPDEVAIGKQVRAGVPQLAFGGAIIVYKEFGTSVRR